MSRRAIGFRAPAHFANPHSSQLALLKRELCPVCGRSAGPGHHHRALAGEDARPRPQGPREPDYEAQRASSRSMRRAGSIPAGVSLEDFFRRLSLEPGRENCIAHLEKIPAREARFASPEQPLPSPLSGALAEEGIGELYLHQAQALDTVRRRDNTVVVTGTASGKTLCYNLPVFENLLADPEATALYLFPTKALAQDQLKGILRLAGAMPELGRFPCGTYDGDTSTHTRRKLRAEGRLILSNPDMLHAGILPSHTRWARFFMKLRYVVIDEIHSYRGIFGSNVGAVLRRLRRICRHYGSDPVFISSSATIGNPKDLAESLIGEPVTLIDSDGSPRGEKLFVFWNPPRLEEKGGERRSANSEAREIMAELLKQGRQTICFSRTRVSSELIYRYTRDRLEREAPHLAGKIRAYRGGYLPEERREIERQLFSGELMGVSSTNALELGIDVGGLDAAILVGMPSTVASAWQQAGRAGRSERESCAVLVGHNDPAEQYMMRHPGFFFRQNPEKAVVDHANPFLLLPQLRCAAYELPLDEKDRELFGPMTGSLTEILEQRGDIRRAGEQGYYASTDYPSGDLSLRQGSLDTVSIVEVPGNTVIGNVDLLGAMQLVYPEAIYLHDGETHFVRELDLEQKVAYVEQRNVDYYTQPISEQKVRLDTKTDEETFGKDRLQTGFGDVTVSQTTFAFKKVKFRSLDSLGWGKLDLPWHELPSRAFWLCPTESLRKEVAASGEKLAEAMAGLKTLVLSSLPVFAMCDRADLGAVVDASNLGQMTLFVYDRFYGGLGYSRVGFEELQSVLEACLEMLVACDCEDGCPACVGLPNRPPGRGEDPDLSPDFAIPGKKATRVLLEGMLGIPGDVPGEKTGNR
ncbi:MAG: DEAD/DEAH box helicase [Candidatus Krumholzibacteria bacterium]|nr:DEAD/DEAH box helicase [Candidatus Krumholzibacteria bacterium]MDP6669654.1 DEAD/DEAH box helicase [Candidatus Krumholzibacteria bacterium]MDP7022152.1 DEAD/DEAH box helicase [Candidatus Krumholzibacteria bacterium]